MNFDYIYHLLSPKPKVEMRFKNIKIANHSAANL